MLRTSWMFLRPYRWQMALVLVSIMVVTATGLLTPWLIRALVQVVRVSPDEARAVQGVTTIALALLAAYGLRSLGQFLTNSVSHIVAWSLCHDLRVALYRQLQRFSPAFYASRQSGEIVSRVIKDTDNIEPLIADIVYEFVVSALLMVGTAVVLIALDPWLALLALAPLPLVIALQLRLHRPIFLAFGRELERLGVLSALVQENVAGMKEIQLFNRQEREFARVGGISRRYAQDQIAARRLIALLQPSVVAATGASIVLVVWVGGRDVVAGRLPIEDLVAFVLYLVTFYQPVQMLIDVSEGLQLGVASARRIHEVLQTAPDVADPPDGIDPGSVRGAVVFERVQFAYVPGLAVLRDISCAVAPGQTLALVGPTGAGKSTLAGLVARLYDPQQGRVLIDGVDVRAMQLDGLRRNISMVLQDIFLFNGSVRENIRYGKPEASDDEIVAAAQAANAHGFIMQLPDGYETEIGERGVKLSGGQKQRLSIARALLKDAPILILDEATSAVDTETEAAIQQALQRLMHGRTCLVIAHRLSTIRHADLIAVLDEGRIVELGHHDALVRHGGLYQRLYDRQHSAARPQPSAISL